MKYDAFISYRHMALDLEIAKKLHKTLETYHIPKSVQKKTGKKKINRVFRDQEELPIGSDLNDNISAALAESEYLIVICSPDTPESYWVLKEIETFIELHDREHVLAILIDGEPWTSFPAPLLTDDKGNAVEPLAADIRAKTPKERNQKFQSEFLRLAAPLIGCTYDDLRQRHKERIIRRNITIGGIALATVALFGAIFGIYNAVTAAKMTKLAEEKTALAEERTRLAGEIMTELKSKQENQSRFYAEESTRLMESGQREDAALLAIAGLPSPGDERPYVSEAEYALANALYAYNNGSSYNFDRTLPHKYTVNNFWISDDQTRIISVDSAMTVSVWDSKDMSLLVNIPANITEGGLHQSIVCANADKDAIYICYGYNFLKLDYNGKQLDVINCEDYIQGCDIHAGAKRAAMIDSEHSYFIDLSTFKVINTTDNTKTSSFDKVFYSPEYNQICACHYHQEGEDGTFLSIIDGETGATKDFSVPGRSVYEVIYTKNRNLAVVHSYGDFFVNPDTTELLSVYTLDGKKMWSTELDTEIIPIYPVYNMLDSRKFTKDGKENNQVVISVQYDTFTYDEMTGNLLGKFSHASPVTGFYLFPESNVGYFSFLNGEITPVDTVSGLYYSEYTIKTTLSTTSMKACPAIDGFIISENNSPLLYSLKKNSAPDKKELPNAPDATMYEDTNPSGKYYVLSHTGSILYFFDPSGKELFNYDLESDSILDTAFDGDTYVVVGNKNMFYINPYDQTVDKKSYGSMLFGRTNGSKAFFTDSSPYVAIYTFSAVDIVDYKKKETLAEIDMDAYLTSAQVSQDGTKLYVGFQTGEFRIYDIATGKIIETGNDEITVSKDILLDSAIEISGDGKYIAINGSDSEIHIYNAGDLSEITSFPLYSNYSFHMEFSRDSKTLITQDNDYRIYFYDIENQRYINTLVTSWRIKKIIFDEENNMTAFTDTLNLYLVNNSGYGMLAYVPGGISYIKDEKKFITKAKNEISSIKYKRYDELIEMAKKQFPDAELTEEKKIKYNIN